MSRQVDVLIIGGGSNGTGLARDLSKRGLRVLLCEKNDLGGGATGASSAMIHGGPRYLLGDTQTTIHSCRDSGYIQKIAPHLCFRIPFLVPIAKHSPFGPMANLLYGAYFDVYDKYTPLKNGIPHGRLSEKALKLLEPALSGSFRGGVAIDEWGINTDRLCLLNALDAKKHGAEILTYTEVLGLITSETGAVCGAKIRREGYEQAQVEARFIVNCGGAWADKVAKQCGQAVPMRPGKGVHLIYDKRFSNFAVITQAKDGREVFVIPYQNETWVGTTDDDYYEDLDDVRANAREVAYLQEAMAEILPLLNQQHLIGTRAGLRNTVYMWGVPPDQLSRKFVVLDHAETGKPGLISLIGGKLASYRAQAQEVADLICKKLRKKVACKTHTDPLPGGDRVPSIAEVTAAFPIPPLAAQRLISRHGSLVFDVLSTDVHDLDPFAVVDAPELVLACEINYALRHELVTHLKDLPARCRLTLGPDLGLSSAGVAAQLFAERFNLSVAEELAEREALLSQRLRSVMPVLSPRSRAQIALLRARYPEQKPSWTRAAQHPTADAATSSAMPHTKQQASPAATQQP